MVIDFVLDYDKKITIIVPDLPKKINYFYPESEKLHRFDEATVYFFNLSIFLPLKKDAIDIILCDFYCSLSSVIEGKVILSQGMQVGYVGRQLSEYLYLDDAKNVTGYWMWSSKRFVATLLYAYEGKIYFEVARTYPWTFRDPLLVENYVSFEEFMATYKPYAVQEIPLAVAIAWRDQAEKLLRELNSACLA